MRRTSPTSPTLPSLGTELQKVLANPNAHTVGEASALVERLLAELQLLRSGASLPGSAVVADLDTSLELLFAEESAPQMLTSDDVGTLADHLRAG